MTKQEERAELVALARELITVMRGFIEPVNKICCKLDQAAMEMTVPALDEGEQDRKEGKRTCTCSNCGKKGHRATTCSRRDTDR